MNRVITGLFLAWSTTLWVGGGLAGAVLAQQPDAPADALVAVSDADPLELGRVVAAIGDDEVLARLRQDRPSMVRLAAVRATLFLFEPERALPTLADLAGGRDPDLAPAAALAAVRIGRALTAAQLSAREVAGRELRTTIERFARIADDESARADIRQAAAVVVVQLSALLD